jgi:hypothetical protein
VISLVGNDDGEQVYDALIRNAVELEHGDAREARRMLICLIDKYLAAASEDADAG